MQPRYQDLSKLTDINNSLHTKEGIYEALTFLKKQYELNEEYLTYLQEIVDYPESQSKYQEQIQSMDTIFRNISEYEYLKTNLLNLKHEIASLLNGTSQLDSQTQTELSALAKLQKYYSDAFTLALANQPESVNKLIFPSYVYHLAATVELIYLIENNIKSALYVTDNSTPESTSTSDHQPAYASAIEKIFDSFEQVLHGLHNDFHQVALENAHLVNEIREKSEETKQEMTDILNAMKNLNNRLTDMLSHTLVPGPYSNHNNNTQPNCVNVPHMVINTNVNPTPQNGSLQHLSIWHGHNKQHNLASSIANNNHQHSELRGLFTPKCD